MELESTVPNFSNLVVNILAFDYGQTAAPNAATASASYAIMAGNATYSQLQNLGLSSRLGVTVMPGQSDLANEFFSIADAIQLRNWAAKTPYVSWLSFWSIDRDRQNLSKVNQTDNQFGQIFVQFDS